MTGLTCCCSAAVAGRLASVLPVRHSLEGLRCHAEDLAVMPPSLVRADGCRPLAGLPLEPWFIEVCLRKAGLGGVTGGLPAFMTDCMPSVHTVLMEKRKAMVLDSLATIGQQQT